MIKIVAWITEWEQSVDTNPILFCKFQDEMVEGYDLFKEDFVLIIQSPFQRHMLQKFGTKGICCDSTHGTKAYDVEVCEDEDALQQLEKSVNSSYSLFTLIKQHKYTTSTISAAIPKGSAPANKKIEVQKRFYSTKRKTQNRNIRLAKPTKEEKMEMIENWRNNEK